jgi:hypothetical protein
MGLMAAPEAPGIARPLWRVVRLDETGNRFVVVGDLSAPAADRLIGDLERKGHKQTYFKEMQPCKR